MILFLSVTDDKRHFTVPLNADEVILISVLVGGIVISVILFILYSKIRDTATRRLLKRLNIYCFFF